MKTTLSRPSATGRGTENTVKGSRVEIRTGRDHSSTTVTEQADPGGINQILLPRKSEQGKEKKIHLKNLPLTPSSSPGLPPSHQ